MKAERAVRAAPERGKRPRNRRELIVSSAAELFYRRGYDQVSMGELADAVAVGASALYRHFSGKQELLYEVLTGGLARVHELLTNLELTDQDTALARLSALAINERHLGATWQREARHLAAEQFGHTRRIIRAIGRTMTDQVRLARPGLNGAAADLVAWSMLAVLISPSFHRADLSRPGYEALLAELAGTVLDTPLSSDFPAAEPAERSPTLTPHTRREALLDVAVRMFARSGYTGVGIEDIGAAVGISGPSVYNYFPSKLDILSTALNRGLAVLQMDTAAVYAEARTAPEALRRLVHRYVAFTQRHRDIVDLSVTETERLPEDERQYGRRVQREYVQEWVHLLGVAYPRVDPDAARVRVHAALTVANDVARTPHLSGNEAVPAATELICTRLLGLPG